MAHQDVETNQMEDLGAVAMTKTEIFFEENGKKITIAIFALFVVAALLFGYKSLVLDPAESNAANAIFAAQTRIEGNTPDYQLALNGDATSAGFLEIIDNYGSTKVGNIANHYAGVCYLKLGDRESALKYLKQYKAEDGVPAQIINAQNIGLQGDIAVDNKNYADAVALFESAAAISSNALTTPLYLRKAGVAAIAAGDNAKATKLLESVISLYPTSQEANSAAKYLGTIK
ncbi:MAG: tetratricopeptide repeat protein [Rikenellaceae bacterium]